MITIDDIAKIAGVSNTTVSNVIHGRTKRVSKKTIDKINNIIQETGYVPNMSARALASKSSKVLALINHLDPKRSGNFLADPFYSAFIGAIESTLKEHGYYIMLRTISDTEELHTFLRNWNVAGLFLTGIFQDEPIYHALGELDIPVILTDSYLDDYMNMINIGLHDLEGGYLATKYLIESGHEKIAFASPTIHEKGVVSKRFDGYKKALDEAGLPLRSDAVFVSEFQVKDTAELGRRLVMEEDVTAVFATADIMAAGIMSGVHEAGYQVPRDLSVVGFDDINWCKMTNPMLTSVHQDANVKGEIAADYMVALLEGRQVENKQVVLPVSLSVRESVLNLKED